MGSSSVIGHIFRNQVIDLMAEVACSSAHKAYDIMSKFPEYREAKDCPDHPFWITSASTMRDELLRSSV